MASSFEKFLHSTIIASQGDYTEPDKGASTDVVSIPKGFPAIYSTSISGGGKYVSRRDINGFLRLLSGAIHFFQCGGIMEYEPEISRSITGYAEGAKLWFKNENYGCWTIIESTRNNNQVTPALSTIDVASGAWRTVFPNLQDDGIFKIKAKGIKFEGLGSDVKTEGCPTPSVEEVNSTAFANVASIFNAIAKFFSKSGTTVSVANEGSLQAKDVIATHALKAQSGGKTVSISPTEAIGCPDITANSPDSSFVNKKSLSALMPYNIQVVDTLPSPASLTANTIYFVKG